MYEKHAWQYWTILLIGFALTVLSQPVLGYTGTTLPEEVVSYLNTHFQNWKLAPIREEIRKDYEAVLNPSHSLHYVTGDFNGDQSTDYAVYVPIP
jgi:hypothetical protein